MIPDRWGGGRDKRKIVLIQLRMSFALGKMYEDESRFPGVKVVNWWLMGAGKVEVWFVSTFRENRRCRFRDVLNVVVIKYTCIHH